MWMPKGGVRGCAKAVGGEVVARREVRVVEGRVRGLRGRVMPRGEGVEGRSEVLVEEAERAEACEGVGGES